jgi:hypothetical protein
MRLKNLKIMLIALVILLVSIPNQAYARLHVLSELTHDYTVTPGDEIKGSIDLKNNSPDDMVVRLYFRDYSFNSEGKTFYLNPGQLDRSNASWIKLEYTRINIPANKRITLQYTINVPNNQDLEGTYWSILMVEPIANELVMKSQQEKVNVGIQESVRFGVQMITSIAGTGKKQISFTKAGLSFDNNGNLILNVDLQNRGDLWVRPNVWANIYRNDGTQVGKFEGTRMRMFPETGIRQKINLGNLKAGKYMALVVADNNDEYVVGAEYKLTVE